MAHLSLILSKGHHLHSCLSPGPPEGCTHLELLPPIPSYSERTIIFPLLQAQNIRVVTNFSTHISCHLDSPNPALLNHDAISSSPMIQILFLFIPVNSTWLSTFKFPYHLYAIWICCLQMIFFVLYVSSSLDLKFSRQIFQYFLMYNPWWTFGKSLMPSFSPFQMGVIISALAYS